MKKYIVIAAALLAGFAACKPEAVESVPAPVVGGEYTISIDAVKASSTKVLIAGGDTLAAVWGKNDTVAVCIKENGKVIGKLYPTNTLESTTKLVGTISLDSPAVDNELYLIYPYIVSDDGFGNLWPNTSYMEQDGRLDTISDQYDFATCGVTISSIGEGGDIHTTQAKFYNRQAIVKFSLKNQAGEPLYANKLIIAASLAQNFWYDDYYPWTYLSVVSPTATNEFTVALHNTCGSETYAFYAVTSSGVYTAVSKSEADFADGKYYQGSVKFAPVSSEGFDYISEWSITGNFGGLAWDNDLSMSTDGAGRHFAGFVTLSAGNQFKFRKNRDWNDKFGGFIGDCPDAFGADPDDLATDFVAPADGVYDLYLDTNLQLAIITPAAIPYAGFTAASDWNVSGTMNNWGTDAMKTDGNGAYLFNNLRLYPTDQFKFRQGDSWAVNYGGMQENDPSPIGTEFSLNSSGNNLLVSSAGTYDLLFYPGSETCKIVPSKQSAVLSLWSVCGDGNDWGDSDMSLVNGKWVSQPVVVHSKFKIRANHAWTENRGGTFESVGTPFKVSQDGPDIVVPYGQYIVTYDPANGEIVLEFPV